MRWSGATGAIARCKSRSTVYARTYRSVPAWHWICGVKPKPKAGNKPSPHFIVHGLDKPGVVPTVSILVVYKSFHSLFLPVRFATGARGPARGVGTGPHEPLGGPAVACH